MVMAVRSIGTSPTELMPGAWRAGYPGTLSESALSPETSLKR